MNECQYRRVQVGLLHKCVIYILESCNGQSTARFQSVLHSMCGVNRYVKFELLNIHYKTRNDHGAHNVAQISTPISALTHAFHVDNNLRDTYIPAVRLCSVLSGLSRIFATRKYVCFA